MLAPLLHPILMIGQVAGASGDTAVVSLARDPLLTAVAISQLVIGILVTMVLFVLLGLLFLVYRAAKKLQGAVVDFKGDPLLERARGVATNVDYMTRSIRSEVERANQAVAHVSGRLQQASQRMEERVEEFNALLEVVQGEAEETFLDTASAARGVRAGARSLTDGKESPGSRRGAKHPVGPRSLGGPQEAPTRPDGGEAGPRDVTPDGGEAGPQDVTPDGDREAQPAPSSREK